MFVVIIKQRLVVGKKHYQLNISTENTSHKIYISKLKSRQEKLEKVVVSASRELKEFSMEDSCGFV